MYLLKRRRLKKEIFKRGGIISKGSKISIAGELVVGKNLILNSKGIDLFRGCQITVSKGSCLILGDNVGISQTSIYCKNRITIGNYVNIGAGCLIIDSNFHSIDWKLRESRQEDNRQAQSAPIVIGHHAFIGARTIILKGVTIGDRTIIQAGSVVSKDIPSDCIAGGNPCQVIKLLENEE